MSLATTQSARVTSADPATSRRLQRLAESVRAAVERALLDLSEVGAREVEGGGLVAADRLAATDALRDATAHLSRFLEAERVDAAAAEKLELAMGALRAGQESLPNTSRIQERLARFARWLGRAFELAISQIPLHAPESAAPPSPEMLASIGVPRAHHVKVPVPRLIARESDDDEDAWRAAADDDDGDEAEANGEREAGGGGAGGDERAAGGGGARGGERVAGGGRARGDGGVAGGGGARGDERVAGGGGARGDERVAGGGGARGDERVAGGGGARGDERVAGAGAGREAGSAEVAQCLAIARECFEDIGSMGSLRRLRDEERWVDAEPFEGRLLASLDAVVALDSPLDPQTPSFGLVNALHGYATEWDVPDLGRAFALAFTASCLASETAMRWVVLALRRAHPRVWPAFVDALSLGSSDAIDRTIAELCDDEDAAIVSVALAAATRRDRGELPGALLLIAHPSPEIACAAITLLARTNVNVAAPLLARFLDEEPAVVGATAAAALVTLGDPRGAERLRALLATGGALAAGATAGAGAMTADEQTAPAEEPTAATGEAGTAGDEAPLAIGSARRVAFEALCLLGDPADIALLAAFAGTSESDLPWLGWHGFPDAVPAIARALIGAAGGIRFEPAQRLHRALERILGRGCPAPHGGPSYEAEVSEWVIAREKERPIEHHRLRFGRRWTAGALVDELAAPDTLQGDRRVLARELPIATRGRARIDVEGWVAAQRVGLRRARDVAGS